MSPLCHLERSVGVFECDRTYRQSLELSLSCYNFFFVIVYSIPSLGFLFVFVFLFFFFGDRLEFILLIGFMFSLRFPGLLHSIMSPFILI